MKKEYLILLFIGMALSGCYSLHKNFIIHEHPILENSRYELEIDGVYFVGSNEEKCPSNYFFFYKNGLVYVSRFTGKQEVLDFWSNPNHYIDNLNRNYFQMFKPRDMWGSYKIRNDSIFIQYFYDNGSNQVGLMNRNSIDLSGIITSSHSFTIDVRICTWCDKFYGTNSRHSGDTSYFSPSSVYKFEKSDFKVDSSLAWFSKRSWYTKNLHESRR